jgi:hypothetical protein
LTLYLVPPELPSAIGAEAVGIVEALVSYDPGQAWIRPEAVGVLRAPIVDEL